MHTGYYELTDGRIIQLQDIVNSICMYSGKSPREIYSLGDDKLSQEICKLSNVNGELAHISIFEFLNRGDEYGAIKFLSATNHIDFIKSRSIINSIIKDGMKGGNYG